jgi:hypothetical protein
MKTFPSMRWKQLAAAQSDKDKDFYTNCCDCLPRGKTFCGLPRCVVLRDLPRHAALRGQSRGAAFRELDSTPRAGTRRRLKCLTSFLSGFSFQIFFQGGEGGFKGVVILPVGRVCKHMPPRAFLQQENC